MRGYHLNFGENKLKQKKKKKTVLFQCLVMCAFCFVLKLCYTNQMLSVPCFNEMVFLTRDRISFGGFYLPVRPFGLGLVVLPTNFCRKHNDALNYMVRFDFFFNFFFLFDFQIFKKMCKISQTCIILFIYSTPSETLCMQ